MTTETVQTEEIAPEQAEQLPNGLRLLPDEQDAVTEDDLDALYEDMCSTEQFTKDMEGIYAEENDNQGWNELPHVDDLDLDTYTRLELDGYIVEGEWAPELFDDESNDGEIDE